MNYDDRDPFYLALLRQERIRKKEESTVPLLTPLRMEHDWYMIS